MLVPEAEFTERYHHSVSIDEHTTLDYDEEDNFLGVEVLKFAKLDLFVEELPNDQAKEP